MKKILFGIMAGMLVATAVSAYQAEEHKSGSPMGGMMKGMMGEQSQDMMQGMKEMMGRMTKMMDMCGQMMGNRSEPKKAESSK
jgi:Spy/CpxP family protein refolding chaperone